MERANHNNTQRFSWKILLSALLIFAVIIFTVLFVSGFFSGNDSSGFIKHKGSQRINLLIAGLDPDGLRTDFLAICSYNTETKKADILTIPENTRMFVGGRYQKISAAHALYENDKAKGISGTVEALNRLTAIPLNYYIEFSTENFTEFINELDSIEFEISENMKYHDKLQNLKINLKKGYQRLDGSEAMQALRYTSYDDGEQQRTLTQQEFMKALAEQKLNPKYIAKFPKLYESLHINTNLNAEDIVKYSNILLSLSHDDLTFHTLPGHQEEPGVTYWIADLEAQKKLIEEVFGYNSKNITTDKNKQ